MIDVLNKYFVCVEVNATDHDGVPTDVPGLWPLRRTWETVPFSRVSFSGEWVIDPSGEHLLGVTACRHFPARAKMEDSAAKVPLARTFQNMLEDSLKRFRRLREGGAAEGERIAAEVRRDLETIKPCWLDVDVMTAHFLDVLWQMNIADDVAGKGFEEKYAVILNFADADIRRRAIELFGRFAEKKQNDEFRVGGRAAFLRAQVVNRLDDEDPGVRRAAAVALHQFSGVPVPSLDDAALLAAAEERWGGERTEAALHH